MEFNKIRLGSKGASEVKNHEFFKKHNIDWVKLLNKEIDPPFKPIVTVCFSIFQYLSKLGKYEYCN